jgi:hypothetical protein
MLSSRYIQKKGGEIATPTLTASIFAEIPENQVSQHDEPWEGA